MHKIRKNTTKNKPQRVKFKELYNSLKEDIHPLLKLLSILHGVEFEQQGKHHVCTTSKGLRILSTKNGFTVHNHSSKYDILNGNISTQIKAQTKHLSGLDKADEQYNILEKIGINTATGIYKNTTPKAPRKAPKKEAPKQKIKPTFANYSSHCGKSTTSHFKHKTGANTETLEKYGVRCIHERTTTNGHVFKHGSSNFAFAYTSTNWIKVKEPNSNPKFKDFQKLNNTQYCFGLDQLPTKGENLIICAGEDDAICINHHMNKYGIWAVCFGGERNEPLKTTLSSFKKAFKKVFVLYDNDSTGIEKSQEIAHKNGLIWINIKDAFDKFFIPDFHISVKGKIKDICNVYEYFQSGKHKLNLKPFIDYCLVNSRLEAYKDDPFSIGIDHCYLLNFNQYIGEKELNKNGINPTELLIHRLHENDRLILQSPAGTGKSTWIQDLAKSGAKFLGTINNSLECSTLIIAEPTTSIAEQLYNSFIKNGVPKDRIVLVMGKDKNAKTRGKISPDKIIIVVYDSIKKVSDYIDNCLLIVDEYHQIGNDQDYRAEAMRLLWKAMIRAKKILLLSATPNYLLTTDLHPNFNYKLIIGKPSTTNKIHLKTYLHKCPKTHLYDFIETLANKEGTICIKRDMNSELAAFTKLCEKRKIPTDHFTSSMGRAYKEGNVNYKQIMKDGQLENFVRFLVFTTVMEAGVSLNFKVALMALLDAKSWSKIVQLCTRPRLNKSTGTNQNIEAALFIMNSKKKAKEKEDPKYTGTIKNRFKNLLNDANSHCLKMNKLYQEIPKESKALYNKFNRTYKVSTDLKLGVYFDKSDLTYKVDVPEIIHKIHAQETAETPTDLLLKRISRFDERFIIYTPESILPYGNKALDRLIQDVEIERDESISSFINILNTHQNEAIQAVCYLSKDTDFKNNIKGVLQIAEIDKEKAISFIESNKEAFKTREPKKILKRVYDLMFTGKNLINAIRTISDCNKSEIDTFIDRTNIKKRCIAVRTDDVLLNQIDKNEVRKYQILTRKFKVLLNKIQQNRRQNKFTGSQLADIVNKELTKHNIIKKPLTKHKALAQIKALYDLDRKTFRIKGKDVKRIYFKSLKVGKIIAPK